MRFAVDRKENDGWVGETLRFTDIQFNLSTKGLLKLDVEVSYGSKKYSSTVFTKDENNVWIMAGNLELIMKPRILRDGKTLPVGIIAYELIDPPAGETRYKMDKVGETTLTTAVDGSSIALIESRVGAIAVKVTATKL